jgi:hypothetical protein
MRGLNGRMNVRGRLPQDSCIILDKINRIAGERILILGINLLSGRPVRMPYGCFDVDFNGLPCGGSFDVGFKAVIFGLHAILRETVAACALPFSHLDRGKNQIRGRQWRISLPRQR